MGSGAGLRGARAGRLVARPWGQACSATPRGGWRLEARAPLAHGLGCRVTVTAGPQEDELRRARPRSKQTALRSWVARGRPHQAPQTGRLQRWKSTVPVWRPEVGDQGGGGRLLSWLLAGGSLATSSSLAGAASPRPLPRACVRVQMSPLYKGSSHVGLRAHPADLIVTSDICRDPILKSGHVLRYQGSGLHHMNFGGHSSTITTVRSLVGKGGLGELRPITVTAA